MDIFGSVIVLFVIISFYFSQTAYALAPIFNDHLPLGLLIPDRYIVKYKPDADDAKQKEHEKDINSKALQGGKRGIFGKLDVPGLHGYLAELPLGTLEELVNSELIDYIEKDTVVKATRLSHAIHVHPFYRRIPTPAKRDTITQPHAPWGLARISHRARNFADYVYDTSAGQGVRVYVLDTGIRTTHAEFLDDPWELANSTTTNGTTFFGRSRAIWGANFVENTPDIDEDGHGTHVAGTIAGRTYGVVKKATVVAVKVLDKTGSGYMSGLLQGLNWAVSDATKRGVASRSVINMSLGGPYTQSVNEAVKAATDMGITVIAAAGNDRANASEYSPASASTAITVGAIGRDDYKADFSNWGPGVDIFAPGVTIPSAFAEHDNATLMMSGTSMAAPHVAGLAAYFLAKDNLKGYTEVSRQLLELATAGVGDKGDAPDRIAYNGNEQ